MKSRFEIRHYAVLALAVLAGVGVAAAQPIQKWKTREGKLYFGDRPPAGSTKIGQEGSNEPTADGAPQDTPPASPQSSEREKLSIEVSRARTEIERSLNLNADRLEDVARRTAEAERRPNFVTPWMEKRANIRNERAEALESLESEKRAALTAIAGLWKRFDELDARVKKTYGGSAPDWWRSSVRCARCPSRTEAEAALR